MSALLQVEKLDKLASSLKEAETVQKKLTVLNKFLIEEELMPDSAAAREFLDSDEKELIYKALCAIKQADFLLENRTQNSESKLKALIKELKEVERFYAPIGGIVGYHVAFMKLLTEQSEAERLNAKIEKPEGLDLTQNNPAVRQAVRWGIEHAEDMAEIYPVQAQATV